MLDYCIRVMVSNKTSLYFNVNAFKQSIYNHFYSA